MVKITKECTFDGLEYKDEKLNLLLERKRIWKVHCNFLRRSYLFSTSSQIPIL